MNLIVLGGHQQQCWIALNLLPNREKVEHFRPERVFSIRVYCRFWLCKLSENWQDTLKSLDLDGSGELNEQEFLAATRLRVVWAASVLPLKVMMCFNLVVCMSFLLGTSKNTKVSMETHGKR